MSETVLLGNEAVAVGALHAGIWAVYSYPGTPSTEITEYIIAYSQKHGGPHASWCANEKTAFETALGVSLAGGRALSAMKHVGLNVAADPFINSALATIRGGLVLAVADDPGMHSSQNEQDSRFYADFAKIICLEPSNQQEAYTMTLHSFELSERFHIPVMLRLVTRIAHGRSRVTIKDIAPKAPMAPEGRNPNEWVLLPSISRKLWKNLAQTHKEMIRYSEESEFNTLSLNNENREYAVITSGIAKNYYFENHRDLENLPSHLHIGVYPLPEEKIRALTGQAKKLLIIEEGYPFVEKYIRGIVPTTVSIAGRMDETIPATGELSPDIVRKALGLPGNKGVTIPINGLVNRPPQFCYACPHIDSFAVLQAALMEYENYLITSDIGCYTLSALPPYSFIHSTICMGASIGMAKGAAEAGRHPVAAVIGDSTFLHSGITSLLDAIGSDTNMTVVILDNEAVAMTGAQSTILPSQKLKNLILGLGVGKEHVHVLKAEKSDEEKNVRVLKSEITYKGLSVIILHRECIVATKRKRRR